MDDGDDAEEEVAIAMTADAVVGRYDEMMWTSCPVISQSLGCGLVSPCTNKVTPGRVKVNTPIMTSQSIDDALFTHVIHSDIETPSITRHHTSDSDDVEDDQALLPLSPKVIPSKRMSKRKSAIHIPKLNSSNHTPVQSIHITPNQQNSAVGLRQKKAVYNKSRTTPRSRDVKNTDVDRFEFCDIDLLTKEFRNSSLDKSVAKTFSHYHHHHHHHHITDESQHSIPEVPPPTMPSPQVYQQLPWTVDDSSDDYVIFERKPSDNDNDCKQTKKVETSVAHQRAPINGLTHISIRRETSSGSGVKPMRKSASAHGYLKSWGDDSAAESWSTSPYTTSSEDGDQSVAMVTIETEHASWLELMMKEKDESPFTSSEDLRIGAEYYSFDDFKPLPMPCETEPAIYSSRTVNSHKQPAASYISRHHRSYPKYVNMLESSSDQPSSDIIETCVPPYDDQWQATRSDKLSASSMPPHRDSVLSPAATTMLKSNLASKPPPSGGQKNHHSEPKYPKSGCVRRRFSTPCNVVDLTSGYARLKLSEESESPWKPSREEIHGADLSDTVLSLQELLLNSPENSPEKDRSRNNSLCDGSLPKIIWDSDDEDDVDDNNYVYMTIGSLPRSQLNNTKNSLARSSIRSCQGTPYLARHLLARTNQTSTPIDGRNAPRLIRSLSLEDTTQRHLPSKPPPRKSSLSNSLKELYLRGTSKKKKKKEAQHILALFHAVEQADLEQARRLLDTYKLNICCLNHDGLTVLDLALLTNNEQMSHLLMSYGAKVNPKFEQDVDARPLTLINLVNEAEAKVDYLNQLLNVLTVASSGDKVSTQMKDYEQLLLRWQSRLRLVRSMKHCYQAAGIPDPPPKVTLEVTSNTSLRIKLEPPLHNHGAMVIKYKIEWSTCSDFSLLSGKRIINDPLQLEINIAGLVEGCRYYFRARAANIRGYGEMATSMPRSACPSSWREVDGIKPRVVGKTEQLASLYDQVMRARYNDGDDRSNNQPQPPQGVSKMFGRKLSLRNIFGSTSKLQKSTKRGLYLAVLIYYEDRVLVTHDDNLPLVEVVESYSAANISSHLHWLMKIANNWQDVQILLQDLEKMDTSGVWSLRTKLLECVANLQTTLGIRNLGQFHYQPVEGTDGSLVFVTVLKLSERSEVTNSITRWTSTTKLKKKVVDDKSMVTMDMLISKIPEMISMSQSCHQPLSRGLYVTYLKLYSSLDSIKVVVPHLTPNVLPHFKVRDNPNVTKEEWEELKTVTLDSPSECQQRTFIHDVIHAAKSLIQLHGYSESAILEHGIYDQEVIELGHDVSFIFVLPPRDQVCGLPGQKSNEELSYKALQLPLQAFEAVHKRLYERDLMKWFCRTSSLIEVALCITQQAQRLALTAEEISSARENANSMVAFQKRLEDLWSGTRWLTELVTFARSKDSSTINLGILQTILDTVGEQGNVKVKQSSREIRPSKLQYSPVDDFSALDSSAVVSDRRPAKLPSSRTGEKYGNSTLIRKQSCQEVKPVNQYNSPAFNHSPLTKATDNLCDRLLQSEKRRRASVDHSIDYEHLLVETRETRRNWHIRVFIALDCLVRKGESIMFVASQATTAQDVTDHVASNLSAIWNQQSGELSTGIDAEALCLVCVIGARERILRESFHLAHLQSPWTDGHLYVRRRTDRLAALELEKIIANLL